MENTPVEVETPVSATTTPGATGAIRTTRDTAHPTGPTRAEALQTAGQALLDASLAAVHDIAEASERLARDVKESVTPPRAAGTTVAAPATAGP